MVVFQYAGHGTQVDDLDGDETEDRLDEAFCPVDFPTGRFLIDDDIRSVFSHVRAGVNVTSFIDCCHSGSITRALVPWRPAGRERAAGEQGRGSSRTHATCRRSIGSSARRQGTRSWHPRHGQRAQARAGPMGAPPACSTSASRRACPTRSRTRRAGAGQFTSRAARLLAEGGPITHAAFIDRVLTAFGTAPPQHPVLDCAPAARDYRLLEPAVVGA